MLKLHKVSIEILNMELIMLLNNQINYIYLRSKNKPAAGKRNPIDNINSELVFIID